jgi:hypothetical protein
MIRRKEKQSIKPAIGTCAFFDDCQRERGDSREFKGMVETTLKNIEESIKKVSLALEKEADKVMNLYWRVGVVSGGVAVITSLIVDHVKK